MWDLHYPLAVTANHRECKGEGGPGPRVHSTSGNSNVHIFPQTVAMAEHFKEVGRCLMCLSHLETPVYLKCGYVCCLRCLDSLRREPDGEGLLCPSCSMISRKKDIKPSTQLGRLIAKVKELEPQLEAVLRMNPKILRFQGTAYPDP